MDSMVFIPQDEPSYYYDDDDDGFIWPRPIQLDL